MSVKTIHRDKWQPTKASYGGWHSDDPEDTNFILTIFPYREWPHPQENRRILTQEMVEAAKTNEALLQKHHAFSLTVKVYSLPPTAAGDNDAEKTSDMAEEIMNLGDTDVKTFHDCNIGRKQRDTGRFHIDAGRFQIHIEKFQIDIERFQIATGRFQIDIERFKINTGRFRIHTGKFQIDTGRFQIDTGKFQIDKGRLQINIDKFQTNMDPVSYA
ncbi:uncharacterized protein LOC130054915 [Ostrea edulis]|uniref:uncharacterized protein LOC130054915 n=1 Tax=Ostrea edulis TaxID=37623 RepID=UPI0024AEFA4E|nr:uncharacterized protein LOC130054915 [Ostrea edulis]